MCVAIVVFVVVIIIIIIIVIVIAVAAFVIVVDSSMKYSITDSPERAWLTARLYQPLSSEMSRIWWRHPSKKLTRVFDRMRLIRQIEKQEINLKEKKGKGKKEEKKREKRGKEEEKTREK